MIKNIAKIANKLDALGLTKEADILDRYITKVAGIAQFGGTIEGASGFAPPQDIANAMVKWLDYVMISNVMVLNSSKGMATCIDELVKMLNYVAKVSETDFTNRADFANWYIRNIESSTFASTEQMHNLVADDFEELADDMQAHIKSFPNGTWDNDSRSGAQLDINRYYPVIKSLRIVAKNWRATFSREGELPKPEEKMRIIPPKNDTPMTMGETVYPFVAGEGKPVVKKKPASPVRKVNPGAKTWDEYIARVGSVGETIKTTWNELSKVDESAGRRDNSFESYKAWYTEKKGGEWSGMDKSPNEVLDAIKGDIERCMVWKG